MRALVCAVPCYHFFIVAAFILLDTWYNKLTERIIGSAMRVHTILGMGFQEAIYQRSLAIEMEQAGLAFGCEIDMPLYYKGVAVGSRRVDFSSKTPTVLRSPDSTAPPKKLYQLQNPRTPKNSF
ncbi:MAG: GxxExxY protein [Janthinobacterium lividum]